MYLRRTNGFSGFDDFLNSPTGEILANVGSAALSTAASIAVENNLAVSNPQITYENPLLRPARSTNGIVKSLPGGMENLNPNNIQVVTNDKRMEAILQFLPIVSMMLSLWRIGKNS